MHYIQKKKKKNGQFIYKICSYTYDDIILSSIYLFILHQNVRMHPFEKRVNLTKNIHDDQSSSSSSLYDLPLKDKTAITIYDAEEMNVNWELVSERLSVSGPLPSSPALFEKDRYDYFIQFNIDFWTNSIISSLQRKRNFKYIKNGTDDDEEGKGDQPEYVRRGPLQLLAFPTGQVVAHSHPSQNGHGRLHVGPQ